MDAYEPPRSNDKIALNRFLEEYEDTVEDGLGRSRRRNKNKDKDKDKKKNKRNQDPIPAKTANDGKGLNITIQLNDCLVLALDRLDAAENQSPTQRPRRRRKDTDKDKEGKPRKKKPRDRALYYKDEYDYKPDYDEDYIGEVPTQYFNDEYDYSLFRFLQRGDRDGVSRTCARYDLSFWVKPNHSDADTYDSFLSNR